MDDEAPDNVLEVTARALTYYLDVSADCTRRITAVDGALKAIITRMQVADMTCRASKDLAEQCVKVSWFWLVYQCVSLNKISQQVCGDFPASFINWMSMG